MLPDRVSNPGPLTYESGALIGLFIKNVIKRLDDTDQNHLMLKVRIYVFGIVVKFSTPYGEE